MDLNDDCPKDCFSLPKIDQLIDSTAEHELLSFTDAFSGYNQIQMDECDIPNVSFITDQGLYYYIGMPNGLKNVGATYQMIVNKIFKHLISKNMDVYVGHMLIKILLKKSHVDDLNESFELLKKYNTKIKPAKYAFGVSSGKFLGHIVS